MKNFFAICLSGTPVENSLIDLWSITELKKVVKDFGASALDFNVLELQDESIDELLALLSPLCRDKAKAPIICLDYLQIVASSRESTKMMGRVQ